MSGSLCLLVIVVLAVLLAVLSYRAFGLQSPEPYEEEPLVAPDLPESPEDTASTRDQEEEPRASSVSSDEEPRAEEPEVPKKAAIKPTPRNAMSIKKKAKRPKRKN
jgi:hypothetical protein